MGNFKLKGSTSRALFFLLTYILIRFLGYRWLNRWNVYLPYAFEGIFVLTALYVYRAKLRWFAPLGLRDGIELLLSLLAGGAVYLSAKGLNLVVPFDFSSWIVVLLLLFFGPLLEEMIFRQALWFPLEELKLRPTMVIVLTSVFFSMGHLQALGLSNSAIFGPIRDFILFQTLYTFFIALWWGYRFKRKKSFFAPLSLHITFNMGFYVAYVLQS
jgi:membrane protease YdiL (CAAX protease family)